MQRSVYQPYEKHQAWQRAALSRRKAKKRMAAENNAKKTRINWQRKIIKAGGNGKHHQQSMAGNVA